MLITIPILTWKLLLLFIGKSIRFLLSTRIRHKLKSNHVFLSVTEPPTDTPTNIEDPDELGVLNPLLSHHHHHPPPRSSSIPESLNSFLTMDDRDSIYLDTISIASNSTFGNNKRRSLALSRQTIYHSAEDVNDEQLPEGNYPLNGILKKPRDQGEVSQEEVDHYARKLENLEGRPTDEVTALLPNLDEYGPVPSSHSTGQLSNKTKKATITYSQWKARVNNEYESSSNHLCSVLCLLSNQIISCHTPTTILLICSLLLLTPSVSLSFCAIIQVICR